MSADPTAAPLAQVHGFTPEGFIAAARELVPRGFGAARDLYKQAVLEGRFEPEALGLSAEACGLYRAAFRFALPAVAHTVSEDGDTGTTAKAVLRLDDGYEVECVLIPMGRGKHTLCVSSQVGCKMGCTFCETARMGLLRHLRPDEIVGQLLVARHVLGWDFKNVVFMGMGEALDNPSLFHVLRLLNDPGGMSIAQECLTVCTVGSIDGIERLKAEGFTRLNLSVSLNSADDATRSRVMPVNRKNPLVDLQAALAAYRPRRNFALGVNYCLMPGLNDTREDAARVAAFCAPIARTLVNVIPYNPGNAPLTRAPSEDEVDTFIGWLREEGLAVRRRVTKGRSVMAACGQLGNAELRRGKSLPVAR
ncbi:MAG: radical SAM protein [Sandaracinaceae bacterium]|nr:radical SAM protein [Sandaracinaceae bacterium]